jgi:nucleoside-diphosphate-sugar epimerase
MLGCGGLLSLKRVLVTGSTGFVGACLAHRLVALGCDLHLIIRENSNPWRLREIVKDTTVHTVDLSDSEGVTGLISALHPEIIFHLATYGGYPLQQDLNQMVETNLKGTATLLNACLKTGFESFINTGSSSEYGPKQSAMKETDLLEPTTNYGVTKAAATLYCQSVAHQTKMPVVTLRLFSPFGSFEEGVRLIPTVIQSCLRGENPRLASGTAVRDFIYIDDVIDAYCLAAENPKPAGMILNVGSGAQHSVSQVVTRIIELTGAPVAPEWGSVPGRNFDTVWWMADTTQIKDALGWQPKHRLDDGLQKTIDWFSNHRDQYQI